MRIGFIYRGDPRHRTANRLSMLKNVAAASRLGHEVVLITPREGMSAAAASAALAAALEDFGIAERFPVKTIPRFVFKGHGKRSFDFLAACWARTQRFDLVWSREFYAAHYSSAFGLDTIVEHHHPFTERQATVARRMLKRGSFRGIAAISDAHRRLLTGAGWPEDRVMTAHSGVDLAQFEEARKLNGNGRARLAAPGQRIVLYAGSLYAGKGGDQILLAAERIRGAKFVLLGGRDFEVARLKERARSLGLSNVELTGHVPHASVPAYLSAADILVAPFTEDGRDIAGKVIIPFASPIKLFEYMAAGKPIVASNVGAIPEILRHEENALLSKPGSVDELVQNLSRLLTDAALSERLGATARSDVRVYSWEKRVARVLSFARGEARTAYVTQVS
jgi:glycosyltransferase involved in cell wall biosynthesis